jgi:hypothetical protein
VRPRPFIVAEPVGADEFWMIQIRDLDATGNDRVVLVEIPLPVSGLRFIRAAFLQRPTPQDMEWQVTLPAGQRFPRWFLRLPGVRVLVDAAGLTDGD